MLLNNKIHAMIVTSSALFLALVVAPSSAGIFQHKLKIRTCVEKLATGTVRMWDEPWEDAPEDEPFDGSWDSYYGGTLRKISRGKVWSKAWSSDVDLFDDDTVTSNSTLHRHLFQDLVLGGEDDEICISDIRAETQMGNGKYKLRWRYLGDFWLAGLGSEHYKKPMIEKTPCYTEVQIAPCGVTFVRERNGGVDHYVKGVSVDCKEGHKLPELPTEPEEFPQRRLQASEPLPHNDPAERFFLRRIGADS
jgi:hypothetical protein